MAKRRRVFRDDGMKNRVHVALRESSGDIDVRRLVARFHEQ
jgi:hypothetical protein